MALWFWIFEISAKMLVVDESETTITVGASLPINSDTQDFNMEEFMDVVGKGSNQGSNQVEAYKY